MFVANVTMRLAAACVLWGAAAFATAEIVAADEGYASWYGPGFQGNRMANGQPFDQNDSTITANNEYPMGTWLRVTNPGNGKSVTVQVRDRGGFGRGLDLSRAAFFALNPPNGWGFTVRYEPVSGPDAPAPIPRAAAPARAPAPPRAAEPKPAPQTGNAPIAGTEYVVQLGDTVRRIAEAAGVPVQQIIDLNALADPDSLQPGQNLLLRPRARLYTVQPGDTLNDIVQSLGTDRSAILAANNIDDPDLLKPGQQLKLPS